MVLIPLANLPSGEHGVSDHFPVFQKSGMVLAGGDRNRLQLFPDVFQKSLQTSRRESEISADDTRHPDIFLQAA